MEWLDAHVLWWYWVVAGILFVILELALASFVVLWLGIAAILVGIIEFLFTPSFSTQLYLWTALSIVLLATWFGYFRRTWRSPVGQAEGEHVHIPGQITEKLSSRRYRAEFELPVLGDRRWIVESKESLKPGDEVEVEKVYGQIIKVRKRNHP